MESTLIACRSRARARHSIPKANGGEAGGKEDDEEGDGEAEAEECKGWGGGEGVGGGCEVRCEDAGGQEKASEKRSGEQTTRRWTDSM